MGKFNETALPPKEAFYSNLNLVDISDEDYGNIMIYMFKMISYRYTNIQYLDTNNLYGWVMSQKLPVNDFKWIKKEELLKFNVDFIKNYDENGNTGYFLEVDIDYWKELFNLHKDLPFLPESKKVNKVEKLICSTEYKKKNVIHIRSLKPALIHGLKLRKVHRVIQFKQKAWLKVYINITTKLKKC